METSLITAAIGVFGTVIAGIAGLGGVLITQRRSDERSHADREWERERWVREDQARTFEQRRESYLEFYESIAHLVRRIHDFSYGHTPEHELEPDWEGGVFKKLQRLDVFATPEVSKAADTAYQAVIDLGVKTRWNGNSNPEFQQLSRRVNRAEQELLSIIRLDLSVPGSLPLSGSPTKDAHAPDA